MSATWSPPAGDRPELVERGDRGAGDLGQAVLELLLGDAELLGDLLVGRRAGTSLRLELGDRALDVARARAHRARHPVQRAQLVDDRALDPRDRVGLELDVALRVVALDRADQAEQAVRDEVALVDVRRQPAAEPPGDVLDERRVREDQPVAERAGRASAGTRARGSACRRSRSPAREYAAHRRDSSVAGAAREARDRPARARDRAAATAITQLRPPAAAATATATTRQGEQRGRARRARAAASRGHARDATRRAARATASPSGAGPAEGRLQSRARTEGRSSIGRAPVSKTGGCRFESCRPCASRRAANPHGYWVCRASAGAARSPLTTAFIR